MCALQQIDHDWLDATKKDPQAWGAMRSTKGLTFLRVYRAGHMVPMDKPEESLQMLQSWLTQAEGFT